MNQIPVRFIINQLSEDELADLKNDHIIISKMILTPDDFKLFHYLEGDLIEVQTDQGYRLWCKITNLECIEDDVRIILIFTLRRDETRKS